MKAKIVKNIHGPITLWLSTLKSLEAVCGLWSKEASFNKTEAAIFLMQTVLPEGFPLSQLDCTGEPQKAG